MITPIELDREQIAELLPHKDFMLLPEYVAINQKAEGGIITAVGIKNIWPDDPFMKVHPWAYPGALIYELSFQVAAVLTLRAFTFPTKIATIMKGSKEMRFGKTSSQIGDTLIAIVNLTNNKKPFFFFEGYVINQRGEFILQISNITGAALPIE